MPLTGVLVSIYQCSRGPTPARSRAATSRRARAAGAAAGCLSFTLRYHFSARCLRSSCLVLSLCFARRGDGRRSPPVPIATATPIASNGTCCPRSRPARRSGVESGRQVDRVLDARRHLEGARRRRRRGCADQARRITSSRPGVRTARRSRLDGHRRQSRHRRRQRRWRRRPPADEDRSVDIEPAWSRTARRSTSSRARGRGFDIFSSRLRRQRCRRSSPMPAINSARGVAGRQDAGVRQPGPGKLGTGGIWTRPSTAATPTLVHYEESEYRMRPQWTPDGTAFLFGSDERVPTTSRSCRSTAAIRSVVTNDAMGEFSPAARPDGTSSRSCRTARGPMTLFVAPIGGGPVTSWRRSRSSAANRRAPTGRVRGARPRRRRQATCRRASIRCAADGRAYTPDGGFRARHRRHRDALLPHDRYVRARGAGRRARRSKRSRLRYPPASTTVDVPCRRRRRRDAATWTGWSTRRRAVGIPATRMSTICIRAASG